MARLSAKRIGEIGLHIFSFEEMPRERWLEGFKNLQEIEFAIKDSEGFLARAPADSKMLLKVLNARKGDLTTGKNVTGKVEETAAAPEEIMVQGEAIERGTFQQDKQSQIQPQTEQVGQSIYANVIHAAPSRIEMVVTDKGVYFHIDSLRERLSVLFNKDEDLFMKACAEAGVDIFTEYVSEATKKKLSKAVHDLIKSQ